MKGHVKKNLRKMLAMLLAVAMTVTYLPETSLMAFAAGGQSIEEADASQPAEPAVAETADNTAEDEAAEAPAPADNVAADTATNMPADNAAADSAAEASAAENSDSAPADAAANTPAADSAEKLAGGIASDEITTYNDPDPSRAKPYLFGFGSDQYNESGDLSFDINGMIGSSNDNFHAEWQSSMIEGAATLYVLRRQYENRIDPNTNNGQVSVYVRLPRTNTPPDVAVVGGGSWLTSVSIDPDYEVDFKTDSTDEFTCYRILLNFSGSLKTETNGAVTFSVTPNGGSATTFTVKELTPVYKVADNNGSYTSSTWKEFPVAYGDGYSALVPVENGQKIQLGILAGSDELTITDLNENRRMGNITIPNWSGLLSVTGIEDNDDVAAEVKTAWEEVRPKVWVPDGNGGGQEKNESISYADGVTVRYGEAVYNCNDDPAKDYDIFTYGATGSSAPTGIYYPELTVNGEGSCDVDFNINGIGGPTIRFTTLAGYTLRQDESGAVDLISSETNIEENVNHLLKPASGNPKFYLYKDGTIVTATNETEYYLDEGDYRVAWGPVNFGGVAEVHTDSSMHVYLELEDFNDKAPDIMWDEVRQMSLWAVIRKRNANGFWLGFTFDGEGEHDDPYRLHSQKIEQDFLVFAVNEPDDLAGVKEDIDTNGSESGWKDWVDSLGIGVTYYETVDGRDIVKPQYAGSAWQYKIDHDWVRSTNSSGKIYVNPWDNQREEIYDDQTGEYLRDEVTIPLYVRIKASIEDGSVAEAQKIIAANIADQWITDVSCKKLGSYDIGSDTYNYYEVVLTVDPNESGTSSTGSFVVQASTPKTYTFKELVGGYQISNDGKTWTNLSGQNDWEWGGDTNIELLRGQYVRFNMGGSADEGQNPRGYVRVDGTNWNWDDTLEKWVLTNDTIFEDPVINAAANAAWTDENGFNGQFYGDGDRYVLFDYDANGQGYTWYPVLQAKKYGGNNVNLELNDEYGGYAVSYGYHVSVVPDISISLDNNGKLTSRNENPDWDDLSAWTKIKTTSGDSIKFYLYDGDGKVTDANRYQLDMGCANRYNYNNSYMDYVGKYYWNGGSLTDSGGEYDEKTTNPAIGLKSDATGVYLEIKPADFQPKARYRLQVNFRVVLKADPGIGRDFNFSLYHEEEARDAIAFAPGDMDDFSYVKDRVGNPNDDWSKWQTQVMSKYGVTNADDLYRNIIEKNENGNVTRDYYVVKDAYVPSAMQFSIDRDWMNVSTWSNTLSASSRYAYQTGWEGNVEQLIYYVSVRVRADKAPADEGKLISAGTGNPKTDWIYDHAVELIGSYDVDGVTYNYYRVKFYVNGTITDYQATAWFDICLNNDTSVRVNMKEALVEYQISNDGTAWGTDWQTFQTKNDRELALPTGKYVRFRIGGSAAIPESSTAGLYGAIEGGDDYGPWTTHTDDNGVEHKGMFDSVTEPSDTDRDRLSEYYWQDYGDRAYHIFKQSDGTTFYPVFKTSTEIKGSCGFDLVAYDAKRNRIVGERLTVTTVPQFTLRQEVTVDGSTTYKEILLRRDMYLESEATELHIPSNGVFKFYLYDGENPVTTAEHNKLTGGGDFHIWPRDLSNYDWEDDIPLTLKKDSNDKYYFEVDFNNSRYKFDNWDYWLYGAFNAEMEYYINDECTVASTDPQHMNYDSEQGKYTDAWGWNGGAYVKYRTEYIGIAQVGNEPADYGEKGYLERWDQWPYHLNYRELNTLIPTEDGKVRFYLYKGAFDESDRDRVYYKLTKPANGDVTITHSEINVIVPGADDTDNDGEPDPIVITPSAIGYDTARGNQPYFELDLSGKTYQAGGQPETFNFKTDTYNIEMMVQFAYPGYKNPESRPVTYTLEYCPVTIMEPGAGTNFASDLASSVAGGQNFTANRMYPDEIRILDGNSAFREDGTIVMYLRIPSSLVPAGDSLDYITLPANPENGWIGTNQAVKTNWFKSFTRKAKIDLFDKELLKMADYPEYPFDDPDKAPYVYYTLRIKGDPNVDMTRGTVRVTLGGVDYDFTFEPVKAQYAVLDSKTGTYGPWKDTDEDVLVKPGEKIRVRVVRGAELNTGVQGYVQMENGWGGFELNNTFPWDDIDAAANAWDTKYYPNFGQLYGQYFDDKDGDHSPGNEHDEEDMGQHTEFNKDGDNNYIYDDGFRVCTHHDCSSTDEKYNTAARPTTLYYEEGWNDWGKNVYFTYGDNDEKIFYHTISAKENVDNFEDGWFSFGVPIELLDENGNITGYDMWNNVLSIHVINHRYEYHYEDDPNPISSMSKPFNVKEGEPLRFYVYKDGVKFNIGSAEFWSTDDWTQNEIWYSWVVETLEPQDYWNIKEGTVCWKTDKDGYLYLQLDSDPLIAVDPEQQFDFANNWYRFGLRHGIDIDGFGYVLASGNGNYMPDVDKAVLINFMGVDDKGKKTVVGQRMVTNGKSTTITTATGAGEKFEFSLENFDRLTMDIDKPFTTTSSNPGVLKVVSPYTYVTDGKYLNYCFNDAKLEVAGLGSTVVSISYYDTKGALQTVSITVNVKYDPAKSIKGFTVTGVEDEYAVTGQAIAPVVVLKDGAYTMVKDKDYTVAYAANTKPGTAKITITGIDGYKDSIEKTFKIYGTLTYAYVKGLEKTPDGKDLPALPAAVKFYDTGVATLAAGTAIDGYTFGWYSDEEGKTAVTSVAAGTSANPTYYGKWIPAAYKITYMDGETAMTGLTPASYTFGTAATLPATATKAGYIFAGWYAAKDLSGTAVTAIAATETGDKTFYAKWVPAVKTFTVTFNVDGGSAVAAQTVEDGKTATRPADPTKDKCVFGGWFTSATFETEFDFATAIKADTTVYAKWYARGLSVDPIPNQTYTGSALTPEVKVYDGTELLREGTDYSLKYTNNVNVGTASVKVTGKGAYTGNVTCEFKIVPMSIEGEGFYASAPWEKYTGSDISPKVTLMYGSKALKSGTDFEVTDKFKDAGVHTATVTGKGNYTGSISVTFGIVDTAAGNVTLISDAGVKVKKIKDQKWNNGEEIKPAVELKKGSTTLVENTDYTLSYRNNKDAGKGYVIVTGIGAYVGTREIPFTIKGTAMSKIKVTGLEKLTYSGAPLTQTGYTLKTSGKNGVTLTENVDYTVSYTKNVNAGTAYIIFTGKGGYTGSLKKSFQIQAYDIKADAKNLIAVAMDATVPYVKGGAKPVPDVSYGDASLRAGVDYKLSYKSNTKADKTAKVTITGKGNFKGSVTKEFKVGKQNIAEVFITVPDIKLNTGKGKYISKPVLIDENGKNLAIKTDYLKSVKYTLEDGTELGSKSKVTEAGTVITVTVTGTGSYEGTVSATYTIREKSTTAFTIKKIKIKDKNYNDEPVTLESADITTLKVGKNDLTLDSDYEIIEDSYFCNDAKGTATVILKGIGNYTGQKQVKFKILAKKMELE